MSIKFRCEACHKTVKAPDDAAGKRGKCPYCEHSSYIPAPVAEGEEVSLAPLDDAEEQRRQQEIEQLVAQERDLIAETGNLDAAAPLEHREDLASEDLHHFVINYCLYMTNGKLDQAAAEVERLRPFKHMGLDAIGDFLAGKAAEPALESIPAPVLKGFLKELQDRLA